MAERLDDGVVGVWFSTTPQSEAALVKAAQLLSEDERHRAARFVRPGDRDDFIWSHAVLRRALAAVGGRQAGEWRFGVGPHGKPHVAGDQRTEMALDFNLSHTRGCCACAVGRGVKVGIDVEREPSGRARLDIARRFFATAEADVLAGMAEEQADRHFLEMWTLKEAYVKATGVGLTLAQPSFAALSTTGAVELPADAIGQWWFWRCSPENGVILSVAASPLEAACEPRIRFVDPADVALLRAG